MEDEIMNVCKSQYKNVDFGLNNFVGFSNIFILSFTNVKSINNDIKTKQWMKIIRKWATN